MIWPYSIPKIWYSSHRKSAVSFSLCFTFPLWTVNGDGGVLQIRGAALQGLWTNQQLLSARKQFDISFFIPFLDLIVARQKRLTRSRQKEKQYILVPCFTGRISGTFIRFRNIAARLYRVTAEYRNFSIRVSFLFRICSRQRFCLRCRKATSTRYRWR